MTEGQRPRRSVRLPRGNAQQGQRRDQQPRGYTQNSTGVQTQQQYQYARYQQAKHASYGWGQTASSQQACYLQGQHAGQMQAMPAQSAYRADSYVRSGASEYQQSNYPDNNQQQVRYNSCGNPIVFDAQGRPVRQMQEVRVQNSYYGYTQGGTGDGRYQYGQSNFQQETSSYSREDYNAEAYAQGKKNKKKGKHRKLKIISIILAVVLVCAVGGFFAYYQMLKSNMSYKGDWTDLLATLTKADYEEPFYVLVIGSDDWEGYGARADAMVLVRVDLNVPQLTMVTIPRDTPYVFPDGSTYKLNAVFENEGLVATIDAVSKVAGVPIADYVEVDFDGLEDVVDSLGGIEVNVPYEFWYTVYTGDQPTVHVEAGKHTLSGKEAVALARMRKAYADKLGNGYTEDSIRQLNIRNMMSAILKKVLSGSITDLPARVTSLSQMVTTDIPLETLIDWATKVYKSSGLVVYSISAPYAGTLFSWNGGETFLTYDDPEAWSQLMEVVETGIDPTKALTTNTNRDGKVSDNSKTIISTGE